MPARPRLGKRGTRAEDGAGAGLPVVVLEVLAGGVEAGVGDVGGAGMGKG